MFCKLKEVASIPPETLTTIRRFFSIEERTTTKENKKKKSKDVPSTAPPPPPNIDDHLTDDDDSVTSQPTDDFPQWSDTSLQQHTTMDDDDIRWLKSSLVTASPNFELLAISAFDRFILLEQSIKSKGRWELIASVQIPKPTTANDNDLFITSLMLLPLGSTHRTSASQIDWTCVCVGLNTGEVLFYTERGALVFVEQFSHSSIKALRFGPSIYPGNQELVVLATKGRAIVVEGLSLYTTLKAARNQVAQGERTVDEISATLQLNTHSLQLDQLRHVHDIQLAGPTKPSVFDQYVSASRSGAGKYARISASTLPLYGNYLCCSSSPREKFASFLWNDGSSTTSALITDAIYSLTSQLTNQIQIPSFGIRSWLGVGTSRRDQPAPLPQQHKKESAVDGRVSMVAVRSALADEGRIGERCYVAPAGWPLIAVADANARVLLIQSSGYRQIIRIWKGYRSARCGWLEASCSSTSTNDDDQTNRLLGSIRRRVRTLFLAIFAPRRGLLEVWATPNGPRVAAFKVSPNGRLLSAGNEVLMGGGGGGQPNAQSQTVTFLDPTGRVLTLSIPFHLSAMDASASAVHDENLLKELELNVSTPNEDTLKLVEIFDKLRTDAAKRKLLSNIIGACTSSVMVEQLLAILIKDGESPLFDHVKFLHDMTIVYSHLTHTTIDAHTSGGEVNYAQLREIFRMVEQEEFDQLHLDLMMMVPVDRKVRIISLKEMIEAVQHTDSKESLAVLGHLLFAPFILGDSDVEDILFSRVIPIISPHLPTTTQHCCCLAESFVIFWLSNDAAGVQQNVEKALPILKQLVVEMDCGDGGDGLQSFLNRVMREHIFKSSHLQAALLLCCMLKAVRMDIKDADRDGGLFIKRIKLEVEQPTPTVKQEGEDDDKFLVFDEAAAEETAWASLDEDIEWWELVSRHLTALALIQLLPSTTATNGEDISLSRLAQKGYGFYREQLGVWAANNMPCARSLAYALSGKSIPDEETLLPSLPPRVCQLLTAICQQFPMSLRAELVLSDCCWESISAWFKDESRRVEKLQLAVDFLELLQPAPRLQHGLALMMWDTFLRSTSQKLVELMEDASDGKGTDKSGGGGATLLANKDRLLRRDVLVVEKDLLAYVACVRSVLKMLARAVSQLSTSTPTTKSYPHFYEDFLERFFDHPMVRPINGTDPRHTLTELATRYKPVNYHLILHHVHLMTVIELQLGLHIRLRLSALFDAVGKRALFESFHSHPLIPLAQVDDRTRGRRQRFLEQVIEQICATTQSSQHQQQQQLGQTWEWKLALELAKEWQLDVDTLRVKEISKLYEWGLDKEAERLLQNVQNRPMLLAALIPTIGQRIQHLMDEDGRLPLKVCQCSAASESTFAYLKQNSAGASGAAVEGVDCQRIRSMIRHANRLVTALSKRGAAEDASQSKGKSVWDLGIACRLLKEMDDICKVAESCQQQQ